MSLDMGRLPLRRDHPLGRSAKREAGLRTSGSMPIHPPSQPEGQWLRLRAWVAAPRLPRRARAGFTPASRFSPPSAGHLANVVPVPTLPTGLSPSGSGTGYGSSNPGFGWLTAGDCVGRSSPGARDLQQSEREHDAAGEQDGKDEHSLDQAGPVVHDWTGLIQRVLVLAVLFPCRIVLSLRLLKITRARR